MDDDEWMNELNKWWMMDEWWMEWMNGYEWMNEWMNE